MVAGIVIITMLYLKLYTFASKNALVLNVIHATWHQISTIQSLSMEVQKSDSCTEQQTFICVSSMAWNS